MGAGQPQAKRVYPGKNRRGGFRKPKLPNSWKDRKEKWAPQFETAIQQGYAVSRVKDFSRPT